jgi:hypothetical protein
MYALSALLVLTPMLVQLPAPSVLLALLSLPSVLLPIPAPLVALERSPLLVLPIAALAHLECKLPSLQEIVTSTSVGISTKPSLSLQRLSILTFFFQFSFN